MEFNTDKSSVHHVAPGCRHLLAGRRTEGSSPCPVQQKEMRLRVRTSQTRNTAPSLSSLPAAGGAVSPERRSHPVHNGSSCPVNGARRSQGGQDAGEGDDDTEGGLTHAEHQGLQRRHVLPSHSVHTRHCRACEGAEKRDRQSLLLFATLIQK